MIALAPSTTKLQVVFGGAVTTNELSCQASYLQKGGVKAVAGRAVFVKNSSANSLDIFPASGEVINALSANAAYSLATVKGALFICSVAGTWDTILTA